MLKGKSYCFVDSSNLFYGGVGRMTWKVDYEKLAEYLRKKYGVKKVFYYSGIETHGYEPLLKYDAEYPIEGVFKYLKRLFKKAKGKEREILGKDINRIKFLKKIKSFGYILRLKPVKHIRSYDGSVKRKANCDVDLTFDVMRLEKEFDNLLLLSGDGDFEILLRYFKDAKKDFYVIANTKNTARSIKKLCLGQFKDFSEMQNSIKRK